MQPRYDQKHPYPIVLLRKAGDTHRLEAIVAMLQRCAELEPAVLFDQHRGADMTWVVPEFSVAWLRQTIALGDDPVQQMIGRLPLMTRHDEPVKLVYWRELHWRPFRYEIVTIDVPWAAKKTERPTLQTREQLFTLMREAAIAFGADVAALYPRSLHALIRFASGEQAHASHEQGNGGGSGRLKQLPSFIPMLPEGLFERFTGLLPAREFDVAAVPESVWWANVWSAEVVERLGRERLEALPWARIEPAGDGGLFLQASKAVPGPKRPGAIGRIADLIEGLDLPAAQDAARP